MKKEELKPGGIMEFKTYEEVMRELNRITIQGLRKQSKLTPHERAMGEVNERINTEDLLDKNLGIVRVL